MNLVRTLTSDGWKDRRCLYLDPAGNVLTNSHNTTGPVTDGHIIDENQNLDNEENEVFSDNDSDEMDCIIIKVLSNGNNKLQKRCLQKMQNSSLQITYFPMNTLLKKY